LTTGYLLLKRDMILFSGSSHDTPFLFHFDLFVFLSGLVALPLIWLLCIVLSFYLLLKRDMILECLYSLKQIKRKVLYREAKSTAGPIPGIDRGKRTQKQPAREAMLFSGSSHDTPFLFHLERHDTRMFIFAKTD
jgi:hypothetical protein